MKNLQKDLLKASFDFTKADNRNMLLSRRDRWKKSRLYLNINENFQKNENLLEVFYSRYNSPKIKLTKQIKKELLNELNKLFPDICCQESNISLRWNQYAGCSCPCSPGYIMSFNDNINVPYSISHGGSFNVSVLLDENEKV
jgi:hypothetical protein